VTISCPPVVALAPFGQMPVVCRPFWNIRAAATVRPQSTGGIDEGRAPCGVYASAEAGTTMARWPVASRFVVPARHPFALAGLVIEAWP
jgi:hypothetical protein